MTLTALRRAPLVHFFAVGALLALGRSGFHPDDPGPPRVIRVTADVADRLAANGGLGRLEDASATPFSAWIDDEVLYREGLRAGLAWNPASIARLLQVGNFVGDECGAAHAASLSDVHRFGLEENDPVIRAQVIGWMRLRLRGESRPPEPTSDELERYRAAHADRYARPSRVTFAHVFVRRDRGEAARAQALAVERRLHGDPVPIDRALRLGDVFHGGQRFREYAPRDVEGLLGAHVSRTLATQPERTWSEPVQSPYGWHLLWVEARTAAAPAALAAVRSEVLRDWRNEHTTRLLAARVEALRATYRVEIDAAAQARWPHARRGRS
jgi:PPIC-type PPIASE domain